MALLYSVKFCSGDNPLFKVELVTLHVNALYKYHRTANSPNYANNLGKSTSADNQLNHQYLQQDLTITSQARLVKRVLHGCDKKNTYPTVATNQQQNTVGKPSAVVKLDGVYAAGLNAIAKASVGNQLTDTKNRRKLACYHTRIVMVNKLSVLLVQSHSELITQY